MFSIDSRTASSVASASVTFPFLMPRLGTVLCARNCTSPGPFVLTRMDETLLVPTSMAVSNWLYCICALLGAKPDRAVPPDAGIVGHHR